MQNTMSPFSQDYFEGTVIKQRSKYLEYLLEGQ